MYVVVTYISTSYMRPGAHGEFVVSSPSGAARHDTEERDVAKRETARMTKIIGNGVKPTATPPRRQNTVGDPPATAIAAELHRGKIVGNGQKATDPGPDVRADGRTIAGNG
jgi:hypothetical protein